MFNVFNQISAGSAILTFLIFILYRLIKRKEITLHDTVMVILSGGMLPFALTFTFYPLFPSLIESIDEMGLQITLTGLVLGFVYVKTILDRMVSDSS